MKNGEATINLNFGGDEMTLDFNHRHLAFAVKEKGWDKRRFRDAFISRCVEIGLATPSDVSIHNWYNGKHQPRARYVRVMSLVLDKPMEFFLGGEAV